MQLALLMTTMLLPGFDHEGQFVALQFSPERIRRLAAAHPDVPEYATLVAWTEKRLAEFAAGEGRDLLPR